MEEEFLPFSAEDPKKNESQVQIQETETDNRSLLYQRMAGLL
jgi:hypothetical protein